MAKEILIPTPSAWSEVWDVVRWFRNRKTSTPPEPDDGRRLPRSYRPFELTDTLLPGGSALAAILKWDTATGTYLTGDSFTVTDTLYAWHGRAGDAGISAAIQSDAGIVWETVGLHRDPKTSQGGRLGIGYDYNATSASLTLNPWHSNEIGLYYTGRWEWFEFFGSTPPATTNSGLSADTTYNVYAYWDGAAVQIEVSSTVTSTLNDVLVKNGDPTHRWIGIVRTNGATLFETTPANRFILNFYNRVALRVDATVNTGAPTPTDYISIAGEGSQYNLWEIHLHFSSQITTSTGPTLLTATIQSDDSGTLTNWATGYGTVLTAGTQRVADYGINVDHSGEVNYGVGTLGRWRVLFTGGTNTVITAGTFSGVLIA